MYWEKEIETLRQNDLSRLQTKRLRSIAERAKSAPYYRECFERIGIKADAIKSPKDIRKFPFTTKQTMREHYPYGFLCVDRKETIRLHSSSGTTGNPTVVFHTRRDIDAWANLMARSMFSAGVRDRDVFQNICGYGLFTGGLGFQYGAERLGCLSIPAGAGNSVRQIKLMRDFGTTVVHTIPSYLGRLFDAFSEQNLDPRRDTALHTFIVGAEPYTEEHRKRIEEMFGIKAYNSYGLSEMNGPGVGFECTEQRGLHVWEDAFLVEIIDPETLEPLPDGESGELVMTTLDRQAMPIIRFRTRDLTRILPGPCPCGRTHRRLDRIAGRSDDMFIIKGCNVFPMQIEGILMKIPEVANNYTIRLETVDGKDEMILEVEVKSDWFRSEAACLDRLSDYIVRRVRDEVLARPVVKLVEAGSLPKPEGKAVRVADKRADRS